MARIYYETHVHKNELDSHLIGVIGYGNQGRAQALNARDSGLTVKVGARFDGASASQARADGIEPDNIEHVSSICDILVITLPDEVIPQVYERSILPYLTADKTFVFAHGFAVHNHTIKLPSESDVVLVAPTGPGHQLRSLYQRGKGLPALVAVEQNGSGRALERCLAYAHAIGCTRAGAVLTSFQEETNTDLFCEQAVLCGGIPELIKASFQTLVDAGYQPELAYISCLKEVKLISDLLFDRGLAGMRDAISTTARFGSSQAGPQIIDGHARRRLEEVLENIESGNFARS